MILGTGDKIRIWPFGVIKNILRCMSTRETRQRSSYCFSLFRSKVLAKYYIAVWVRWPDLRGQQLSEGLQSWYQRLHVTGNTLVFFPRSSTSIRERTALVQLPGPHPHTYARLSKDRTWARVKGLPGLVASREAVRTGWIANSFIVMVANGIQQWDVFLENAINCYIISYNKISPIENPFHPNLKCFHLRWKKNEMKIL